MIVTKNLNVKLGHKSVLHDLSVSAKTGEVTAVIGPNGSGKSTLLKAISGELNYDGSILLNGQEVSATSAQVLAFERGVLPQHTTVSFPFTVDEVVSMGARSGPFGLTYESDVRIQDEALHHVGLAGFAERSYHELSGGEQQRVQLARVLCQVWKPVDGEVSRWLFLDEPVASLDIQHQLSIMQLSRTYASSGGGVVTIMHDLNLTFMYADKVILLKDGRVLASGLPEEVITDENLLEAFECRLKVSQIPEKNNHFVLSQSVEM